MKKEQVSLTEEKEHKKQGYGFILMVIVGIAVLSYFLAGIIGAIISEDSLPSTGNVAVIPITGLIVTGEGTSFSATTNSANVLEFLEKADKNPSIKAILLDINSGGGSPVASDIIAGEIKKIKKPTVALIQDVGASGAFWIATATDHIVANRMSVTGSIGVISSYLEFSGMLDKYNVTYQRLVSGNRKDMGSQWKAMTDDEQEVYEKKLKLIHRYFIEAVAVNRNLPVEDVEKIADGSFLLGAEAIDVGLIDELGGQAEALAWIEKQIKAKPVLTEFSERPSLIEILSSAMQDNSFYIGQGIGSAIYDKTVQNSVVVR